MRQRLPISWKILSYSSNTANLDAVRKGLRELGYVEGRNLIIEYRSADGRAERFPEFAGRLCNTSKQSDVRPRGDQADLQISSTSPRFVSQLLSVPAKPLMSSSTDFGPIKP
jgi:hypothetical protein